MKKSPLVVTLLSHCPLLGAFTFSGSSTLSSPMPLNALFPTPCTLLPSTSTDGTTRFLLLLSLAFPLSVRPLTTRIFPVMTFMLSCAGAGELLLSKSTSAYVKSSAFHTFISADRILWNSDLGNLPASPYFEISSTYTLVTKSYFSVFPDAEVISLANTFFGSAVTVAGSLTSATFLFLNAYLPMAVNPSGSSRLQIGASLSR